MTDGIEIQSKYGILRDLIGGGWMNLRARELKDDTEMILAVAEGILKAKKNLSSQLVRRFLHCEARGPWDIGYKVATSIKDYKIQRRLGSPRMRRAHSRIWFFNVHAARRFFLSIGCF